MKSLDFFKGEIKCVKVICLFVFLFQSWKHFGRKLFGSCVNFGNFMAGNFLGGNFLAVNFLSHVVIFGNFMAGNYLGGNFLGRILCTHEAESYWDINEMLVMDLLGVCAKLCHYIKLISIIDNLCKTQWYMPKIQKF